MPGYRFDTHSVAHNLINMTSIPRDLDLAGAGLRYREMDPFATAVFEDGRRVRFHRSVARTVASIAETDQAEAEAYGAFMADALPLVSAATIGLGGGGIDRRAIGRLLRLAPALGGLARRRGAFFGLWQAAYHLHGQWHAAGGAQGLVDALVRRLDSLGGQVRCEAPVARVETTPAGSVRGVTLEGGERLGADAVVTAIDPRAALLELLDPPLGGRAGADLRATHSANSVQALVHVATDRLLPYAGARPGDWNGLQSFVDSLDSLNASFAAAGAQRLPAPPAAAYAFTPSAIDDALAPPGHHTVCLACPAAPFRLAGGGWDEATSEALTEDLLAQVEARAPGFRDSIVGLAVQTPELMARRLRWPGAHPMHLDVTLDQLALLRPTRALAGHRVPGVGGLYVSGAGTAPVGGVAGSPGRAAARAVLADA